MTQYTSLFLQEVRDNCSKLNQLLIQSEKAISAELLNEIMRLFHSCKGSSSAMGFEKTAALCNALEDIFDNARTGKNAITPEIIDLCLQALDDLEQCLIAIEKTGQEIELPIVNQITGILKGKTIHAKEKSTHPDGENHTLPHVRIDAKKLDALLDLTGELTTLQLQFATLDRATGNQSALSPLVNRLSRLLTDLTYRVSQTRLVPLDQAFIRFPRLVRDLARDQNKDIDFTMSGTNIELDKTVVDHVTSLLVHLLRNAVDHGIENASARKAAGKNAQGKISIDIRRNQGNVTIGVRDDGRPIVLAELKTIARKRGFSEAVLKGITDKNILDLLCNPRFSTTEVTNMISGRGVGLFAVHETVKSLGGDMQLIRDESGKTFILTLPQQLSVVRAILAKVNKTIYALPFNHIQRILSVEPVMIHTTLKQKVMALDGMEIPLLELGNLLGDTRTQDAAKQLQSIQVLLVEHDGSLVGLIVDEVIRNEEVMIKPAPQSIKNAEYFSGYTILGNGEIALIIDTKSLLKHHLSSL